MGERRVRNAEVGGSSPLPSTNLFRGFSEKSTDSLQLTPEVFPGILRDFQGSSSRHTHVELAALVLVAILGLALPAHAQLVPVPDGRMSPLPTCHSVIILPEVVRDTGLNEVGAHIWMTVVNPHAVPIQYDVEILPAPLMVPKLWTGTIEPCCDHGARRSFRMPLGPPRPTA